MVMKYQILLFIISLFSLTELLAENTVFVSKQDFCYTDSVIVSSKFEDVSSYKLNWQFKTSSAVWDSIEKMPCKVIISEKEVLLNIFSEANSFEIRCVYVNKTTSVDSISNSVQIKVFSKLGAPQISTINNPICYNSVPALLSVKQRATGSDGNFTYQWQQSTDNIIFNDIIGEKSQTYQAGTLITPTFYRVIATSEFGCGKIESASSKVDVYKALSVESISNQTICYNTPPKLLIAVLQNGEVGKSYQWKESVNGDNFTDIQGANSNTYQPIILTGNRYYLVFIVAQTDCSVPSNIIKVSVFGEFKPGTITVAQTICYDAVPTILKQDILPTGGSGNYNYQWQVSTDNSNFSEISGQTGTQYQPGNLKLPNYYRLKVSTNGNCGIGFTESIKVTVLPSIEAPKISTINGPICYNTPPALLTITQQANGSAGNFDYQWQQSTDNITFNDINGAKSETYQSGTLIAPTYFRVVATATFGCGKIESSSSKVDVYEALSVESIGDQTICYNTAPTLLIAIPHNGGDIYEYQWQESAIDADFIDIQGANSNSYQPNILIESRYYRVIIKSQKGCSSVTSNNVKITVYVNEIMRKPNSDILVTKEDGINTVYQWGFTTKMDSISQIIPNSNNRFVLLPHDFDSTQYIYWLNTSIKYNITETCTCRNLLNGPKLKKASSQSSQFKVYPNPTSEDISIKFDLDERNVVKVDILNLSGRILRTFNLGNIASYDQRLKLMLPTGIYIMSVSIGDEKSSSKIIIK